MFIKLTLGNLLNFLDVILSALLGDEGLVILIDLAADVENMAHLVLEGDKLAVLSLAWRERVACVSGDEVAAVKLTLRRLRLVGFRREEVE